MSQSLLWKARQFDYDDTVSLLAYLPDGLGQIHSYITPVEMALKEREIGGVLGEGTIRLPYDSARSLMNALWEAGIRPSEVKHPDG